MKKLLFVTILFCSGCFSDSDTALRVLTENGYTNIQLNGWDFGCDKNDTFSTAFRATKDGRTVEGLVCNGFLKGATIRFK